MTLDDLRVLVAACDSGSLSAAGRAGGRTQSAVSQHVRKLEQELGVKLLERGRRGVLPTHAGRILLAAARNALAALDGATRELERITTGEAGALRVATGGTTLRHFMTRPLAQFRRRHPAITFEYVSASSTTQCLDALREDRADLAYLTMGVASGVDQRPSAQTDWVLAVVADDPLARREKLRSADLGAGRVIAMPPTTTSRRQLEQQLAINGVQLTYAATVDEWDTAVHLVELGVGHAIVPAMWIHDLAQHRRLRALPITDLPPVTFGWAARSWDDVPDFARAFADMVDAGIAALGPAARVSVLRD